MYSFLQVFFNLTLCVTKLRVLVLSFLDYRDISIVQKLLNIEQICLRKVNKIKIKYFGNWDLLLGLLESLPQLRFKEAIP
jgi:hypothetical protein